MSNVGRHLRGSAGGCVMELGRSHAPEKSHRGLKGMAKCRVQVGR